VAQILARALEEAHWSVEVFDLDRRGQQDCSSLVERAMENGGCLFIGSPVYALRALPPVVQFLNQLPMTKGRYAVPFITWGGESSGVALLEMAQLLEEKGYALPGAAKILAVHSSMWYCEHPLGEGHPDAEDKALVRVLVRELTSRLQGPYSPLLSSKDMHYQPPDLEREAWSAGLNNVRTIFDTKEIDTRLCNQCGICRDECPVQAIELVPFVKIGDDCIRCYNCVRMCPEEAIKLDLSGVEEKIRKRAFDYSERPLSQIFVRGLRQR